MSLPNVLPSQSEYFGSVDNLGNVTINVDWYLILYNMWSQTISANSGAVPLAPAVILEMVEGDALMADVFGAQRATANAMAVQPTLPDGDAGPSQRDVSNAFLLAADALLPDPQPRAQPLAAVTLTGSPFTFTATSDGVLVISGGTVSAVTLTRQGTTISAGVVAGLIPVRRLDQVQITYTVAPTVTFAPG